ncbi:hypothetical protein Tco_1575053 [Tanacetum coccineum]
MEILLVSASNNTEVGNDVGVRLSSSVVKATCSYSKLRDIFKALIKELKKAVNIQDTLPHALINKIFLKEHQKSFTPRSIRDYLKAKNQDFKIKSKDIKLKIKIQDHTHAKGTSKKFSSIQGSKIHDVTRSEAISAMTTP